MILQFRKPLADFLQVDPGDFAARGELITPIFWLVLLTGFVIANLIAASMQPPHARGDTKNTIGEAFLVGFIGAAVAGILWLLIKVAFKLEF